ncbi:MAG TPA: PDZ domain-containing protein [Segetibacter sp.]
MNKWFKNSALVITASLLAFSVGAQTPDPKDKVKKETDQDIIIRKKGDKVEKTTIVIDGDNVTINGKPLDEFKSDNLSVLRRNSAQGFTAPRMLQDLPKGGFKMFDDNAPFGAPGKNKAMLGVVTETSDGGAKITEVTKESGAEKAGLKKDDVITKVGDRKIDDPDDLVDAISNYKPNDKITLTYKRNNKEATATVTLTENKTKEYSFGFGNGDFDFNTPGMSGGVFGMNRKPKIGLQIQDVEEGKGVKVQEVDENSPAAKAGLKEGDVITEVNGKPVDGVDNVRSEIRDIKEGDTLKVKYNRNGSSQSADIKLPKKLKSADL